MKKYNKKNIIFICTDGVRQDFINNYRSFVDLSKKGLLFSKVITYAPYTIASLHAVFTGIYGNRNGVDNYYGGARFNNEKCKTLTSYLNDSDYYTVADIINELVIPHSGFDDLTIQTHDKDILIKHREIIKKCGSLKKSGKYFFAFLHCDYIHDSLVRDVISEYDDFSKEYFENKDNNKVRYSSYVKKIDSYLDIIYKDIQKENIEDSIILIFSDHGCSLGERVGEKVYGSFCYDYTINTFGIFIHDELFPNKNIKNVIRTVDFMPTVLDIVGIPLSKNNMKLDGESLINFINNIESTPRIAFCETAGLGGPYSSPNSPNVHCIRTDKWKLIFNRIPKTYELYKIENDPNEKNNLYGQANTNSIQKILLNELRRKIIKIRT